VSAHPGTVCPGMHAVTHCSTEMQSQYHTAASLLEAAIAASTEKISSVLFQPITLQDKHCFGQKQRCGSYLGKEEGQAAENREQRKGGGNGTNNASPNKTEFAAAAKIQASPTSEKLMSPAGPKGMVARGEKAASPTADAAQYGMIPNDSSHRAMGSAAGSSPSWWHPAWRAPRCSTGRRFSPASPDSASSSCGAQPWASTQPQLHWRAVPGASAPSPRGAGRRS